MKGVLAVKNKCIRSLSFFLIFLFFIYPISQIHAYASYDPHDLKLEDTFISEDVALYIAAMFVADNNKETNWNDNTWLYALVPMYSVYDDSIEAYCVLLADKTDDDLFVQNGYIIVSADLYKPIVLEFSDEGTLLIPINDSETVPIIELNEPVFYYQALLYLTYKDIDLALACYNQEVGRDINSIDSIEYQDNLEFSVEMVETINQILNSTMAIASANSVPIENSKAYVQYYFSPTYYTTTSYDYINLDPNLQWIEQYIIDHHNACVLYATACIIHYWRPAWDYDSIVNDCLSIYSSIWPSSSDYLVPNGYTSPYIREVLNYYGLTWWVVGSSTSVWSKGKSEITAGNPCILCIGTGGGYPNHAVTAYAWSTFKVTNKSNGSYFFMNFFKVQDGWVTRSRYVCANSTYHPLFWYVTYIS